MYNEEQMFRFFQERKTAQLRLALAEVRYWKNLLKSESIAPQYVERNIEAVESIVNMKRPGLGIPEFPS